MQPNSMTVRKDAFELRQWLNTIIYYMKLNGELDDAPPRSGSARRCRTLPTF